MHVLDVGCGTGVHLGLYQKAGCIVSGIDKSPSMLQVAKNRLGESANLYLGDASHMPFQDESFDLIVMATILHEMPPGIRDSVIEESKRTCKKGGHLLLIDFHPGPIQPFKGWINKTIILTAELAAGGEHFRNFRHFIAMQGLTGLVASPGISVEQNKVVSGGNIALFLIKKL
jgi:ubiquinone/menaquinone biosynthesis C-methylase UbiE